MMPQAPIAVVLLSGGMDSCVCAAIAAQNHRLALLHSSYGQLTEERERRAFEEIADHFQAPHRLRIEQRYMTAIGGSALTDRSLEVPKADLAAAQQGHVPITYVPFRNAHFLSAAVSWAEVLGAERIFVGAVEQDSSGYPDCRPAYYQAFQRGNRSRHPTGDENRCSHAADRLLEGRDRAPWSRARSAPSSHLVVLSYRGRGLWYLRQLRAPPAGVRAGAGAGLDPLRGSDIGSMMESSLRRLQ